MKIVITVEDAVDNLVNVHYAFTPEMTAETKETPALTVAKATFDVFNTLVVDEDE